MMTYAQFKKKVQAFSHQIYRQTYAENRDVIRVKKEPRAIANLEKIFTATLKISNQRGFTAMSMRDLSNEAGLSMGALYSYFTSKDEILSMLQQQQREITQHILLEAIADQDNPRERLRAAVRAHLYLSEVMQPWFYFCYMEAKNLPGPEKAEAVKSERFTESLLVDILKTGRQRGDFGAVDCQMTASVLKAMLQDWYLKRGKYARRNISVERYARFLLDVVETFMNGKHAGKCN